MKWTLILIVVMCLAIAGCGDDKPGASNIEENEHIVFVDFIHGNDSNSGETSDDAYKTLTRALEDVDDNTSIRTQIVTTR